MFLLPGNEGDSLILLQLAELKSIATFLHGLIDVDEIIKTITLKN